MESLGWATRTQRRKGLSMVEGADKGVPDPGRLERDTMQKLQGAWHSPTCYSDQREPSTSNMGFRRG